MFTIDLEDFMVELKDGTVQHVGASNKTGTAKLYDVTDVEVREFGDERVKLVASDDAGSTVELALFPEEAGQVRDRLETLEDEGQVFDDD